MSSRSDDRFEGQAMTEHVVIVGAGIVGVSAGLWLRRFSDAQVTLIDRLDPGEGTSHGNAGVLAACAVVPVTGPGLVAKQAADLDVSSDGPLALQVEGDNVGLLPARIGVVPGVLRVRVPRPRH